MFGIVPARLAAAGTLLLALFLPFAAEADPPAAKPADPPVIVTLAAGGGSVVDSPHGAIPAAVGSLRVNIPFGGLFALEAVGTTGYAVGREEADTAWLRLALGARLEAILRAFSPFAAFRLLHIHYAPATIWENHFGDALAGSSAVGLQHRSGMALATGAHWIVPGTARRVRFMLEVEGSWIPIGNGPEWFVTSEVGLGYAF
jgi:hypothetical protein